MGRLVAMVPPLRGRRAADGAEKRPATSGGMTEKEKCQPKRTARNGRATAREDSRNLWFGMRRKSGSWLPHSKRGEHRLKPVIHGGGQEIGVTVLEGGIGRLGGGAIRIGVALGSDEADW